MQKRSSIRLAAPAACLLAFFAVFAVINFIYLPRFVDGDIYADMELAREMWRQRTLFPANWIFGNQYYTVATPVVAALFYGLTGSMKLSLALATTLLSGLIVWSFCWMLRPFVPERWLRLAALLVFTAAPMARDLLREDQGQLFFTLASYYACYLICLCLVFGDYARAVAAPEMGFRPLPFLLSLSLCFLTGMQSLRELLVAALPILAVEGLRLLRRRARGATLLRAGGYTLANLLGWGLMKLLRVPAVTIYGSVQLGGGGLPQRLLADWHALRGVTGLDAALSSAPRGFFLVFFALVLLAPVGALLLWKMRREAEGLGLLWLLCAVSLLGVLLAGAVVEIRMRKIYLFVWYLLLALSAVPVLRALKGRGQAAGLLALCLLCLGNLWFSYGSSLRLARQRDPAPAIAFCREAEAAGIEYVYGNWEALPGLLVWSDGALIGGFCTEAPFQVRSSINLQDIYTEAHNDRALYVIRDWDQPGFERYCRELGAEYELFGVYGEWIAYRFDRQMMQLLEAGA